MNHKVGFYLCFYYSYFTIAISLLKETVLYKFYISLLKETVARVQFSGHQYAAKSVCRDCRLTLSIFLRENTNFIKNNMLEMTIKQK